MNRTSTFACRHARHLLALVTIAVLVCVGLPMTSAAASSTGDNIALLAYNNVGKHYCSTNSLKGKGFENSCSGEYWCSDFAKWVWAHNGVSGLTVIDDYAWSVYHYSQIHNTLHSTPAVGDLAVYSNTKGDRTEDSDGIHHTAVVIGWSDNGKQVETVSGDWENNPSGSGTGFTEKSTVVDNGSYASAPGYSSRMGMWIVGYVAPA